MKLFNSHEEKLDFVLNIENAKYGLFALYPRYAQVKEIKRRGPVQEDGTREHVVHVLTSEELAARSEDVKLSDTYIRKMLKAQGVNTGVLNNMNSEQLYYYVLGIIQA